MRRKFAISKYSSESTSAKGNAGKGVGEGKAGGGRDGGDLNPLAYSRPDAIVILIRLFVISSPLIRPNSPRFHNASLLLSLFF